MPPCFSSNIALHLAVPRIPPIILPDEDRHTGPLAATRHRALDPRSGGSLYLVAAGGQKNRQEHVTQRRWQRAESQPLRAVVRFESVSVGGNVYVATASADFDQL